VCLQICNQQSQVDFDCARISQERLSIHTSAVIIIHLLFKHIVGRSQLKQ